MSRAFHALALVAALAPAGCATGRIPNTDVPDTSENREVIQFCERYRRAVESKDVRALLSMASPRYFEDAGTPTGDDDYGYEGLQRLLSVWDQTVRQVRYEIRYRRISADSQHNDRLFVDFTYTGSYTLQQPSGGREEPAGAALHIDPVRGATPVDRDEEVWFRRVADNRLELERVGDSWRILSGM